MTLKVLAILSWIWMGISLFSFGSSLATGPLDEEALEEQKDLMMAGVTEAQYEQMPTLYDDMLDFAQAMNDNLYTIQGLHLANVLIGVFGVVLMFQMNRKGYPLYILYTIVPLAIEYVYYPGFMKWMFIGFNAVFGILFVILYGVQMKRLGEQTSAE